MGKTRNLFKKIRDTKGTFHAKMGLIKDRNGMDLTEAEDITRLIHFPPQPIPILISHGLNFYQFSSVQSLSRVRLFVTP